MFRQNERTLNGLNSQDFDIIGLRHSKDAIRIENSSGIANQIIRKSSENKLEYHTLLITDIDCAALAGSGLIFSTDTKKLLANLSGNSGQILSLNTGNNTIESNLSNCSEETDCLTTDKLIFLHNGDNSKITISTFFTTLFSTKETSILDNIKLLMLDNSGSIKHALVSDIKQHLSILGLHNTFTGQNQFQAELQVSAGLTMNSNILPDTNNLRDIGSATHKFKDIRGVILFGDTISAGTGGIVIAGNILPITNNAFDIGASSYKIRDLYATDIFVDNLKTTGDITTHNSIIPTTTNTKHLGDATHIFSDIFTTDILADNIKNSTTATEILLHSRLSPHINQGAELGAVGKVFNDIHTGSIKTAQIGKNSSDSHISLVDTIIPFTNNDTSLGENSHRFQNGFFTGLDCAEITTAAFKNNSGDIILHNSIEPHTNNNIELGSSSKKFANVFSTTFTGTNFIGALTGNSATTTLATTATNLNGNLTGNLDCGDHNINNTGSILPHTDLQENIGAKNGIDGSSSNDRFNFGFFNTLYADSSLIAHNITINNISTFNGIVNLHDSTSSNDIVSFNPTTRKLIFKDTNGNDLIEYDYVNLTTIIKNTAGHTLMTFRHNNAKLNNSTTVSGDHFSPINFNVGTGGIPQDPGFNNAVHGDLYVDGSGFLKVDV